jgi:hypothetical protein
MSLRLMFRGLHSRWAEERINLLIKLLLYDFKENLNMSTHFSKIPQYKIL